MSCRAGNSALNRVAGLISTVRATPLVGVRHSDTVRAADVCTCTIRARRSLRIHRNASYFGAMAVRPDLTGLAADLREHAQVVLDIPTAEPLHDLCERFVADLIRHFTGGVGDEQCYADDAARELFDAGIDPQEAMQAFRRCAHAVWDMARDFARERDDDTYRGLMEQAGGLWLEYEHWTSAITALYHRAIDRHSDERDWERVAYVDALLTGGAGDQVQLRRAADVLGLPRSGQFCVVVTESTADGSGPCEIDRTLRLRGMRSAWSHTLLERVGIVSLGDEAQLSLVRDVLRRCSTGRVGLSPVYDHLGHTPLAARRAHLALSSLRPGLHEVAGYGENPLEMLIASAPETARDIAHELLGALLVLPIDDQRLILNTFEVWLSAGGSVNQAAELLYCHRNTVRHRLARIEALTGRSLSSPRGIAETVIAVEAYRRDSRCLLPMTQPQER